MKPIKIKDGLECVVLMIFCIAFLWFAASNILDNKISHEYPFGYMASDAIQNYGIAEGIKENGNYRYQPMSVAGGYKDVVGTHYPIIFHLSNLLHFISGIEVYDSLMLIVIFMLMGASLVVYLIIGRFSKNAAIIALPLMLLVSYGKFSSGITWGQHGSITSSLFLVSLLWTFSRFEFNELFFIIVFLSASLFGHPSAFVFGVTFIFMYILIKILKKDFKLTDTKKIAIMGAITFVIIFYYGVIVKYTWGAAGFSNPEILTTKKFIEGGAFPAIILFKDFNIFVLIPFFIGFIVLMVSFLRKKSSYMLALLFLFLVGYSNYIGFGTRAFQQRFLWPVYISAFFGIGIYFVLKLIFKKLNILHSSALFLIILVIFLAAYSGKTTAGSMMDPYHWDSFEWIQKNIEKDKAVYFFYQDIINQRALYYASTQRESYVIEVEDFIEDLKEGLVKRNYKMALSAEGGPGLPYRISLFKYGTHMPEVTKKMEKRVDICSMPYIVFDKISKQQQLANYNILIANQLLKNNWIKEVYSNQVVSILKNTKPGEDCIEEQKIS